MVNKFANKMGVNKLSVDVKKKISSSEVIKLFWCSTQLSMKFILLINVKMPTIVGILTFISRMNTTSKGFKARCFLIFHHLAFMGS